MNNEETNGRAKIISGLGGVPIIGAQEQWAVTPGLKFIGGALHQLLIGQPSGKQRWVAVPHEPAPPLDLEPKETKSTIVKDNGLG